ncbi:hypothetical protein BU16DRAFT_616104 [Lophium mytilinum]|uniref:Uncharacterized protein n=1 Tax=Lophium mytilinum TaxID=390894 RepID=A0A6A6QYE9_9PEZI|nr:hypothetical protein BU16DRAFT_616104 [Lophium mytilinum]
MRVNSRLAAFLAASTSLLSVSAGPLLAKRASSTTESSTAPSVALAVSTLNDGTPTTFEAALPTSADSSESAEATAAVTTTAEETQTPTSAVASSTVSPINPSHDFPVCHDTSAAPFCLPNNESSLYVGNTYYITWNPDYFPINSTITIKLNYANMTQEQAWSSDTVDNSWGVTTITMDKAWMQGYSEYNLTFYALMFESDKPEQTSVPYDGPTITLMDKPAYHYTPPEHTKAPNKLGLMIGLPVSLGFVALVVIGLCIGMRKHRSIGIGNIMGRRAGYGAGKSRRQRMGLGKKGAIKLEERDLSGVPQYQDEVASPPPTRPRGHFREDSLGSLVSEDGIRPAGNAFRQEMDRQKTGR